MNTRVKLIALFLASILILSLTGAALAGPGDDAASKALTWLATKQNADGGFSDGFSPDSKVSATADAVIAIASAGRDHRRAFVHDGLSPPGVSACATC